MGAGIRRRVPAPSAFLLHVRATGPSAWHSRCMTADLLTHLHEVAESGSPAQISEARTLIGALASSPDDPSCRQTARLLVNAYLHDPYLTR